MFFYLLGGVVYALVFWLVTLLFLLFGASVTPFTWGAFFVGLIIQMIMVWVVENK